MLCLRRAPLSTGRVSGLALLPLAAALAAPPPAPPDDPRPLEETIRWIGVYGELAPHIGFVSVMLVSPQTFVARFVCPMFGKAPDTGRYGDDFLEVCFDLEDPPSDSERRSRSWRLYPVREPVQVDLQSRQRLAGGGYAPTRETVLFEDVGPESGSHDICTIGDPALELARKIRRAESFSWTMLRAGRSSDPYAVTDEGRAELDKLLDFCGFSREPPAAPLRGAAVESEE